MQNIYVFISVSDCVEMPKSILTVTRWVEAVWIDGYTDDKYSSEWESAFQTKSLASNIDASERNLKRRLCNTCCPHFVSIDNTSDQALPLLGAGNLMELRSG